MRVLIKLATFIIVFAVIFSFSTKRASASKGEFELVNTVGGEARCYALSTLLSTAQYHVLVTCRNLIYPADENNSQYILWSRNAGDVVKLGSLAQGEVFFNTKTPFSQLFVTLEPNDKIKEPGNRTVMFGTVKDVPFLQGLSTPFPTQVVTSGETGKNTQVQNPSGTPEKTVPALTTREKLLIGLKRSSVIAGVALLGLIGLIFVITRSRG